MPHLRYTTPRGITVDRTESKLTYTRGLSHILRQLDRKRGVYLSSGYEYPERYSRWDVASVAPSLEIVGRGRQLEFRALNERGRVLLHILHPVLADHSQWTLEGQTARSEEHTSELQSPCNLVCRLL